MFSQEQFEAYRALGFHAAYGFFYRRDEFAFLNVKEYPRTPDEISDLDKLFPQANTGDDKRRPGQRKTFIEALKLRQTKSAKANSAVSRR